MKDILFEKYNERQPNYGRCHLVTVPLVIHVMLARVFVMGWDFGT